MQGNTHQQTKQPPALLLVMYDDPIKQSIKNTIENGKQETSTENTRILDTTATGSVIQIQTQGNVPCQLTTIDKDRN